MNQNTNTFGQPIQMQQGRPLNVILVPDIDNIDGFSINPGASMLFLNEAMTKFKMRSRDVNGFPLPERIWKVEEVTPVQQTNPQFVTREEFAALDSKLDKLVNELCGTGQK